MYEGYLLFPEVGNYTFYLNASGGIRLIVDDIVLIDELKNIDNLDLQVKYTVSEKNFKASFRLENLQYTEG